MNWLLSLFRRPKRGRIQPLDEREAARLKAHRERRAQLTSQTKENNQ